MRLAFVSWIVGVALVVSGCGGGDDDGPTRSTLADRLAEMCEETRAAVEELGQPRDEGAAVFRPWAQLGRRFVADIRRLETGNAQERVDLASLADYFAGFYDNLQIGYQQYRAQQSTAIKQTLERGYALLASAEQLATRMGAPECAVRPFPET
jgi:hypothetical protein